MKEHQLRLLNNAIANILLFAGEEDLVRAGRAAQALGAILISWKVNGKTRVWKKKSGEILKKYKRSK